MDTQDKIVSNSEKEEAFLKLSPNHKIEVLSDMFNKINVIFFETGIPVYNVPAVAREYANVFEERLKSITAASHKDETQQGGAE